MTPDDLAAHLAAAHTALGGLSQKKRREARKVLQELEMKVTAMMGRSVERVKNGRKYSGRRKP